MFFAVLIAAFSLGNAAPNIQSFGVARGAAYTIYNLIELVSSYIPYFFGYKTDFFSFQNNPKNLDPSYKMDLDL